MEEAVVLAVPDQPGQQYRKNLTGPDLDGSYYLLHQDEGLPEGVEAVQMVEVPPGQYRKLSSIEAEAEMEEERRRVTPEIQQLQEECIRRYLEDRQQEIIEEARVSLEELSLEDHPHFEDLLREPFNC